jgi:hypothetical protein
MVMTSENSYGIAEMLCISKLLDPGKLKENNTCSNINSLDG